MAGSTDYNVYVLSARRRQLLWKANLGGYIYSTPAISDINGDGRNDIVVGTLGNRVHVLD